MTIVPRILLITTLLMLGNVFAQIPGLALTQDKSAEKTAELHTIAIGDMSQRMADDSLFVQKIIQRNSSADNTEAIELQLGDIRRNVDALSEKMFGKHFETLPLFGLESLERHLSFLDKQLNQVQDELQANTRPLSEDASEIAQRKKIWLDTRQSSAETLSPTLLTSIDQLDNEIKQAERAISKPLSDLLKLNHEASSLDTKIVNSLNTVRNQISLTDSKLWNFDAKNLFTAIQHSSQKPALNNTQDVVNALSIQIDFMKTYDQATRAMLTLLVVISVITLPLFIYLSRWAKQIVSNDKSLEHHKVCLDRPFSAWFLFSILCWLIAYFNGPMLRLMLLLILAWFPVMRLQPAWMYHNVGRWIYATAPFFIISFFSRLISSLPLEFRVSLLINGLLLLAALCWLIYHLPPLENGQNKHKKRFARAVMLVYIALISLAVLSNLFGGVHLATLLTEASLTSLYLCFFLSALSELVRAYLHILVISSAKRINSSTQHVGRLFEVGFRVFNLALILGWLAGTLNDLRVYRPLKAQVMEIAEFSFGYGNISITIGGMVLFCVSVFLSFWIAKTIRSVLAEDVLPNMTLPRGVANSVSTMSYYFLLMLGLLVALTAAGFQLSQLAIVIGALSVGIGFGLNTVINNFVCGLILMIERPIQPGDTVELSGTTGKIRDIGIRTTTLTTFEGADVMVPNGMLLSEKLINWTLSNERRRIEIPIGVAYGNDPKTVQALLLAVANQTAGVIQDPPPAVLFTKFGESSLDFSVRAWTESFDLAPVIRSEMSIEIYAALKEAGIEIPFPQRDLNIRGLNSGQMQSELPEVGIA